MDILFDFDKVLHLIAATLGIFSGVIILYFGFKYNPVSQPLGIAQLSVGLLIWSIFMGKSGLVVYWPLWYRLGPCFALICIPMSFLYVVFYTQKRSWKWYDVFHVVPLVIYVIDYWVVFFMPPVDKVILIQQEISNFSTSPYLKSKFFGPLFHVISRAILLSIYWVASMVVYVQWLRSQPSLTSENKVWRNWMMIFLGFQFFTGLLIYLRLFGLEVNAFQYVNTYSVFLSMIVTLAVFFFPSILYGIKLTDTAVVALPNKVNGETTLSSLEQQKLEEAMRTIETHIEANKYFLTARYSIHDFSQDINLPVYQITKALKTVKGLGFVDYCNQKRIQYCINKLNQGEWLNYTLEAIATECSFNNRNSFTQAFKKFSGESPSVYRRRLKKLATAEA